MRKFVLYSVFAALTGAGSAAGATTLGDLRWQYRVIAVFAPDSRAGDAAEQTLRGASGIDERDIAWFVVEPGAIRANIDTAIERASLQRIHRGGGFEAVLVGKDGGVKARQNDALDLTAFFGQIDQMPMRRREMKDDDS